MISRVLYAIMVTIIYVINHRNKRFIDFFLDHSAFRFEQFFGQSIIWLESYFLLLCNISKLLLSFKCLLMHFLFYLWLTTCHHTCVEVRGQLAGTTRDKLLLWVLGLQLRSLGLVLSAFTN